MVGPVGRVAVDEEDGIPTVEDVPEKALDLRALGLDRVAVEVEILAVRPNPDALLGAGLLAAVGGVDLLVPVDVEDRGDEEDEPVEIGELRLLEEVAEDHEGGFLALGYGVFRDSRAPEKGWQTLDPQPRYLTNYIGLRNRLAILDENYVHADYKTRVISNYNFLLAVLDYGYANADALLKMTADADARTVARGLAPKPADTFGLDFDLKALPQPVTVLGFEMESVPREGAPPQLKRTDRKKTFTIPYYADFVQKTTVPLPAGYLVSPANAEVVEKLLLHGILVERLVAPAKLDVLAFKIKEIKAAANLYQGHRTNTLAGEYAPETRDFPAGTIYVSLAQPLANVAAYLLEPRSDDGLLVWNFFDREIVGQWAREPSPCPVYKLMAPAPLVKQTVR